MVVLKVGVVMLALLRFLTRGANPLAPACGINPLKCSAALRGGVCFLGSLTGRVALHYLLSEPRIDFVFDP